MTIALLSLAIILLVGYMLFLPRKKDTLLLKSPPVTQTLPRPKYEQALKDLNEFKKRPSPKSRHKQIEQNSEQYYLERRLNQIHQETDKEQNSYYLACKERDIAWKDYHEYFSEMNLIEKLIVPGRISNLAILRKLYLESEKKVELELGKFRARSRVRDHEESVKQEREDEIERKTQQRRLELPSRKAQAPDVSEDEIQEAFGEVLLNDDQTDPSSESSADSPSLDPSIDTASAEIFQDHLIEKRGHFSQEEFLAKFPDFKGLSYIDDTFSLEDAGKNAVLNADFDGAYFLSVVFSGRHQYKDCSFSQADLSYSIWKRTDSPHRIVNCNFNATKLSFARFEYTAFYNCLFVNTDFRGTQFHTVKFVNCTIENCNLLEVDFSSSVMSSDMIETIDFSDCLFPPKNHPAPPSESSGDPDLPEDDNQRY